MLTNITEKSPFFGYKGPREMTERKIIRDVRRLGDVYLNTGDLLRIDSDGYVYFVDRIGDTFRWTINFHSLQEVTSNVLDIRVFHISDCVIICSPSLCSLGLLSGPWEPGVLECCSTPGKKSGGAQHPVDFCCSWRA